jgi:hypothetical protein
MARPVLTDLRRRSPFHHPFSADLMANTARSIYPCQDRSGRLFTVTNHLRLLQCMQGVLKGDQGLCQGEYAFRSTVILRETLICSGEWT